MSEVYTTADLLADIKQEGMIPTSQQTYEASDILNLATRQLRSKVVPFLSSVHEGYLIWPGEIALESGKVRYPIPSRAVVLGLNDVLLKDADGRERSVPVIPASDRDEYGQGVSPTYGGRFGFYLEWNKVVLTDDLSSKYTTLVIPYMIRPGRLVETSEAGRVTAIDAGTGVVTLSTVPADFTTSLEYDFIKGEGGYEYLAIDQTASAVDSGASTVTFASLPDDLAIGDWLATAGESPVPQIPAELAPILVYETLIKLLKSLGDWDGAKAAEIELMGEDGKGGLKASILGMISPRVKGETKFLVSGYHRGREQW